MCKTVMFFGVLVLLAASFGCATAEKDIPVLPETKSKFEILTPSQAAELHKRTEAFAQAMCRSFQTGDFSHWKALVEKEGEPGKLTCWYLKSETNFVYKKWIENRPTK